MTVVSILAIVLAVLWFSQRWLIYFPDSHPPPPHTLGLPGAEEVLIQTEDDLTLHAWFVPSTAPPTGQTLVVFNGNAGHRGYRVPLARALVRRGIAVLLFEYRGYGGNPGLPSERGLARDARAARAYLESRSDVDPDRIVYFGESLGAAVAVRLATEIPPSALVLRSPFTSLADVGQLHYPFLPVRWLLRDRYPSLDRIAHVRAPLLVIAGAEDGIVPFENSEALYQAGAEPKWLVTIEGADHNDESLVDGPELIAAIQTFLQGVRQ